MAVNPLGMGIELFVIYDPTGTKNAERDTLDLANHLRRLGELANTVSGHFTDMSGALVDAISAAVQKAADLQSTMLTIARISGSDATTNINEWRDSFISLSREIPKSADQLAQLGVVAAQMGITTGLPEFIEVTSKAAEALGINAEHTGEKFGRIANIFGKDMEQISQFTRNFGSGVIGVANAFVATGDQVLELTKKMGAYTSVAGITAEETAALATVLIATGGEINTSATAISVMLRELPIRAAEFAKLTNMSLSEFKGKTKMEQIEALSLRIKELTDAGEDVVPVLNELGLGRSQVLRAVLNLSKTFGDAASSGASFNKALGIMTEESRKGTLIQESFDTVMQGLNNQIKIARNRIDSLAIGIANVLLPVLTPVVMAFNAILAFLEAIPLPIKVAVASFFMLAGAIMAVAAALSVTLTMGLKLGRQITNLRASAISLMTPALDDLGRPLMSAAGEPITGMSKMLQTASQNWIELIMLPLIFASSLPWDKIWPQVGKQLDKLRTMIQGGVAGAVTGATSGTPAVVAVQQTFEFAADDVGIAGTKAATQANLKGAAAAYGEAGKAAKMALGPIANFALKWLGIITTAWDLSAAMKSANSAVASIAQTAGFVLLFIPGVGKVIGALALLIAYWREISAIGKEFLRIALAPIAIMLNLIKDRLSAFGKVDMKGFGAIYDIFVGLARILGVLSAAFLINFWGPTVAAFSVVLSILDGVISAVLNFLIKPIQNELLPAIARIFSLFSGGSGQIKSAYGAINTILNAIGAVSAFITSIVLSQVRLIIALVTGFVDVLYAAFRAIKVVAVGIWDFFVSIYSGIVGVNTGLDWTIKGVLKFFDSIYKNWGILDFFRTLGQIIGVIAIAALVVVAVLFGPILAAILAIAGAVILVVKGIGYVVDAFKSMWAWAVKTKQAIVGSSMFHMAEDSKLIAKEMRAGPIRRLQEMGSAADSARRSVAATMAHLQTDMDKQIRAAVTVGAVSTVRNETSFRMEDVKPVVRQINRTESESRINVTNSVPINQTINVNLVMSDGSTLGKAVVEYNNEDITRSSGQLSFRRRLLDGGV